MAIFPCPIPKITNDQGLFTSSWKQPKNDEVKFTSDGFAVVTKTGLDNLAQYDTTYPSGVYAGKMWKREQDGVLYLCWYQDAPDHPGKCEIKFRKILPQEAFDLLNPGGKDNV